MSRETASVIATFIAASFEAASLEAASYIAASVGGIVGMSPAVIPGACADEDAAREPAWAIVAVRRASIWIIRVVAVSAHRRASHDRANSHADSNSYTSSD
jgi:hypothetical protein